VLVAVTAGKIHSPLLHLSVFSVSKERSELRWFLYNMLNANDNTLLIVVFIKLSDTDLPHSVAYIALKTEAQCNYRIANAESILVINLFARNDPTTDRFNKLYTQTRTRVCALEEQCSI